MVRISCYGWGLKMVLSQLNQCMLFPYVATELISLGVNVGGTWFPLGLPSLFGRLRMGKF